MEKGKMQIPNFLNPKNYHPEPSVCRSGQAKVEGQSNFKS